MRAGRSRWAGRAAENACLALVPAGTGGDQALEPEPLVEARGGTGPPRMFRGLKGALAFDILLIPALKVTHCPLPCATLECHAMYDHSVARKLHRTPRCQMRPPLDQPCAAVAAAH